MTPPPFTDLGKSAKDLFNKGYAHGLVKLDVTTKSPPAVEFKTQAEHNFSAQKLKGNFEIKYKIPDYGTTVTEKWSTDNQISSIVELNNQLAKGLKVILDTTYSPHNAKRGAVFKSEWSGETVKINANMTLVGGPVLDVSGVTELYKDWMIGGQAKFDMYSNEVKSTTVAIGRKTPDYTVHSFTDGREIGASIYHKVHKNYEYGVQFGCKLGDKPNTVWGFASKYQVNPDFCLRTKVDNQTQVSISATHNLGEALKLTVSTNFALTGLPEPTNKFGVGFEYTP